MASDLEQNRENSLIHRINPPVADHVEGKVDGAGEACFLKHVFLMIFYCIFADE